MIKIKDFDTFDKEKSYNYSFLGHLLDFNHQKPNVGIAKLPKDNTQSTLEVLRPVFQNL